MAVLPSHEVSTLQSLSRLRLREVLTQQASWQISIMSDLFTALCLDEKSSSVRDSIFALVPLNWQNQMGCDDRKEAVLLCPESDPDTTWLHGDR